MWSQRHSTRHQIIHTQSRSTTLPPRQRQKLYLLLQRVPSSRASIYWMQARRQVSICTIRKARGFSLNRRWSLEQSLVTLRLTESPSSVQSKSRMRTDMSGSFSLTKMSQRQVSLWSFSCTTPCESSIGLTCNLPTREHYPSSTLWRKMT